MTVNTYLWRHLVRINIGLLRWYLLAGPLASHIFPVGIYLLNAQSPKLTAKPNAACYNYTTGIVKWRDNIARRIQNPWTRLGSMFLEKQSRCLCLEEDGEEVAAEFGWKINVTKRIIISNTHLSYRFSYPGTWRGLITAHKRCIRRCRQPVAHTCMQ